MRVRSFCFFSTKGSAKEIKHFAVNFQPSSAVNHFWSHRLRTWLIAAQD
jgi:hypothetical protein